MVFVIRENSIFGYICLIICDFDFLYCQFNDHDQQHYIDM